MALATGLEQNLTTLTYLPEHWMSSWLSVVYKLLAAWAQVGLDTGAAGQT